MRQPSDDRVLYYRQLRESIRTVFVPELTSAHALDAAALIDRILAEFIVEEAEAPALSAEFGGALDQLLRPSGGDQGAPTPNRFDELRREAAHVVATAAEGNDDAARQRAQRLADVERRFLERVDELRRVEIGLGTDGERRTSAESCSVTGEQIAGYLRGRLPASPSLSVEQVSLMPGGRSKETILATLTGTSELPEHIIVRKDRPVGLLPTKAADEFAVIAAVYEFGGVPVPRPFFAESADVGLGEGTFLVMERVRGRKAGEFFPDLAGPTEHHAEIGRQLAAALARLHSLPLDRLGGTGLDPRPPAVSEEAIVRMVDGIVARIDELTGPSCVTVPLARHWLLEHVPDVVPSPTLCLLQGDFGFHNTLVDGATVTALVDWEAASVGPPARELAAAWGAATTLMPWAAFVEAYLDAGGPVAATDDRAVNYYRVLSALGAFMTSRMGGHLFRTGAKRDLLTAHSGLDSHFRCTRNLARALADAMAQPPS